MIVTVKKTTGATPSSRGEPTRNRILDTAEQLFAERGFTETTLRDISKLSDASLSSITHHFTSKNTLYFSVLDRRARASYTAVEQALAQAIKDYGDTITIEKILSTYTDKIFNSFSSGNKEWINYVQLFMQRAPTESNTEQQKIIARLYQPLRKKYIVELKKTMPLSTINEIEWCFKMFEAGLGTILSGFPYKKNLQEKGIIRLKNRYLLYCVAGFEQIENASKNTESSTR